MPEAAKVCALPKSDKLLSIVVYAAFLRAINVSGSGKVAMADLRQMMIDLGYQTPKTLLQTGNIVFECNGKSATETEAILKAESEKRLGLNTEFFVRTTDEIEAIIANNPYPKEAIDDPSHLLVLFASGPTTPECEEALRGWIKGRETFVCKSNNFYFVYPDNIGDSKLSIKVIERHLGVKVTGRNWNTINKLETLMKA